MRKIVSGTALFVAFLVGCASSYVAPRYLVRPVTAGTEGPQWEIRCVDAETVRVGDPHLSELNKAAGWLPVLKRFGSAGWEPVQLLQTEMGTKIDAVCFKRPLTAVPGAVPG
jgi:hypothetical protein